MPCDARQAANTQLGAELPRGKENLPLTSKRKQKIGACRSAASWQEKGVGVGRTWGGPGVGVVRQRAEVHQ